MQVKFPGYWLTSYVLSKCWSLPCPAFPFILSISLYIASPGSAGRNVQYRDLADFRRPAFDSCFPWIAAAFPRDVQTSLPGAGASLGSSPSLAAADRAVGSAGSPPPVCPAALLLWCCLPSPWIGSPSHEWPPSCSFAEQCPASISVIKKMYQTSNNYTFISSGGLEDWNWAFRTSYISSS